ncbi:hypothetical protein [Streptomyces sp. NPDC088731]|uniref:hypothetical protein n=1 Tax=Streptomyces sp. NPDC088731 TaxID=3365878 RepID=UPI0038021E25
MAFQIKKGLSSRERAEPTPALTAPGTEVVIPKPAAPANAATAASTAEPSYLEQLAQGGGVNSPFTPKVWRFEDLNGSDEEVLATLRSALVQARETAVQLDARVKMRATIEAGTILALMRELKVHATAGYDTFDAYVVEDLGYKNRRRAYDLIEDALNLRKVLPLATQQAIPASQAAILAPVMDQDDGLQRAREVLESARAASPTGRVTASGVRHAVQRLALGPSGGDVDQGEGQGPRAPQVASEDRARVDDAYDRIANQIEAMLKSLRRMQSAGVPPADRARVASAVKRIRAGGRALNNSAAVPEEIAEAEVVDWSPK